MSLNKFLSKLFSGPKSRRFFINAECPEESPRHENCIFEEERFV